MTYQQPGSIADAVGLSGQGEDAAYLAGGHTLIPAMKARLRDPDSLIDLGKIDALRGMTVDGDRLWVGAMTRHRDVETGADVIPALKKMASVIGDPAVRNRGTLGGSLANNDPASDYPAAVLGLDATIRTDRRELSAADFFQGMFYTALEEGELIEAVGFRIPARAAYAKFRHPASRYAMAGVFIAELAPGDWRITVTGAGGDGVFRWREAEEAQASGSDLSALAAPAEDMMTSDIHGSAAYRAQLCTVMLRRAAADL